jgi:hypothetical protein
MSSSAATKRRRDAAFARGLCLCGEKLAPERKACRGCLDDARDRIARLRGAQPPKATRARSAARWLSWVLGGSP